MRKRLNIVWILLASVVLIGCGHRPGKVDIMRAEKAERDSLKYIQALHNLHYSDSLLQVLLPQSDPLLKSFIYSKDEKNEDHGHYVHRLLQTTSNTARNFLQAYVTDNYRVSVQSYYYGAQACDQRMVRLSAGEDFVEKEGSNHAFEVEGWHEILTIEDDDAKQLLSYIATHTAERIKVSALDAGHKAHSTYYLNEQEKKALADTYQLAIIMSNIDALERAIRVANLQIEKYESRKAQNNNQDNGINRE
ncbi:MAG: hypothetical protein MJZ75_01220 [Paludibacteraceae bacterium]|nr:hypothetical protein [Paludibacteraceae bacterium]